MSLITAMTDMLKNPVAMEAAEDIAMFEEELAMEADEFIDAIVDGVGQFEYDAEIEQMAEEDTFEDEINAELEEEDNSISSHSKDTKNDKVGDTKATPDHEGNQSGATKTTKHDIKTENGSMGQKSASADPTGNQSGAKRSSKNDIDTKNGSIGQKNSKPNPAKESASFFDLLEDDEVAMEDDTTVEVPTDEPEVDEVPETVDTDSELGKMNEALDSDIEDGEFEE
jgi:hypothetical protein